MFFSRNRSLKFIAVLFSISFIYLSNSVSAFSRNPIPLPTKAKKIIKKKKPSAVNRPRVSIITSIFKGDEFIKGFLADIVQQSIFKHCELILINANSPGKEESIIKQYVPRYPNIRYIKLGKDPGLYGVWNVGIKMALSDFITNANLDDRRNPRSLEIEAKALEQNPSVDLVYGDFLCTKRANETFKHHTAKTIVKHPDFQLCYMSSCLPGPQPMWRKSMHTKYGLFDEKFLSCGDWEMWCRAVSKGSRFKKIPNFVTGLYYYNPAGLSTDEAKLEIRTMEYNLIVKTYRYLWAKPQQPTKGIASEGYSYHEILHHRYFAIPLD